MENHYNCIYLYINKTNNKKYIGKAKNFNKRHKRHKQHIDSSNNKNHAGFNYQIHRTIRRYGIENFDIIILKENLKTKCLMDLYECYYIKKYNTLTINNGYNVADGGQGANPYAGKSEEEINEIRKKQSDSKKENIMEKIIQIIIIIN